MDSFIQGLIAIILAFGGQASCTGNDTFNPLSNLSKFGDNYAIDYGLHHTTLSNNGLQVQLSLDQSGGARFTSKNMYGSGFFSLKLKIVKTDNGIVMAIYLISGIKSDTDPGNHDELDFEFLGGWRNPYILQTNVFLDDFGGREQRIPLWFDPTKDFHLYQILWNRKQVVFFVDGTPVRVIKRSGGLRYPSKPMYVKGSIWQGLWALPKGTTTDWRKAPFAVQYQSFDIAGCVVPPNGNINSCQAKSKGNWWNQDGFGQLSPTQQKLYNNVMKNLCYNYCVDLPRYKGNAPPECRGQFNPTIAKPWCWV